MGTKRVLEINGAGVTVELSGLRLLYLSAHDVDGYNSALIAFCAQRLAS